MELSSIVFYIIAGLLLACGVMTVMTRKIFRAAVYLLFTLLMTAGIFFFLNYQFIAVVQLLIYAGGVVILILFSIFLTHQIGDRLDRPSRLNHVLGGSSSLAGLGLTLYVIQRSALLNAAPAKGTPADPGISEIGRQLLNINETGYILPFEVVSVLLLAALTACILIALNR